MFLYFTFSHLLDFAFLLFNLMIWGFYELFYLHGSGIRGNIYGNSKFMGFCCEAVNMYVCNDLSHCTSYTFYFIICSLFHSHLYLYIYSLVLCFIAYVIFIFYFIIIIIFLHFPLSGPVPTYISLLIIPCMIVYVTNNKEP